MKKKTLDELLTVVPKTKDLRLSASRVISFINDGPKTLLERKKISNEGIVMGGLIDCLLYEPDLFKEKYYVGDIKKPTASLGILADYILTNEEDSFIRDNLTTNDMGDLEFYDDLIQVIYDTSIKLDLWKRTKDYAIRVSKFYIVDFIKYIHKIMASKDKELITYDQHILALEVIDILKNHKYTKHLFKNDLENYYQFKAEFEYKGFDFLGYIDHIQIDHKNKTICAKDLKTGTPKAKEFINSFFKYKYYIQGVLYQIALQKIKKELKVEEYKILPFEFVYISRYEKVPIIYQMNEKWEKAALNGFITNRGIKYPGLLDTLTEIEWHLDNKIFDVSKYVDENNGLIPLNSDIINEI
jgi:hypothetical protein